MRSTGTITGGPARPFFTRSKEERDLRPRLERFLNDTLSNSYRDDEVVAGLEDLLGGCCTLPGEATSFTAVRRREALRYDPDTVWSELPAGVVTSRAVMRHTISIVP